MMNKCVFIIPYFGKFNNYFQLFLNSCGINKHFDWIIYTDDKTKFHYPNNVHVKYCSFETLKNKIETIFPFKITLDSPYKLCEYKLAYGDIFKDDIKEFAFWGFCDIDLIFGNIEKFITDDILDNYEKILFRGHFTLLKNNVKMNKMYKIYEKPMFIDYKYAFSTQYICHFDEFEPWINVLDNHGIRQFNKLIFADVNCNKYTFELVSNSENIENTDYQIFTWKNGELNRVYIKNGIIHTDEWAYIHLQKRKMKIDLDINYNNYVIMPNIITSKLDSNEALNIVKKISWNKKINLARKINRLIEIVNNIKKGALYYRWIKFINR